MEKNTEADRNLVLTPELHGGRSLIEVSNGKWEAKDGRKDIRLFLWEHALREWEARVFGCFARRCAVGRFTAYQVSRKANRRGC